MRQTQQTVNDVLEPTLGSPMLRRCRRAEIWPLTLRQSSPLHTSMRTATAAAHFLGFSGKLLCTYLVPRCQVSRFQRPVISLCLRTYVFLIFHMQLL